MPKKFVGENSKATAAKAKKAAAREEQNVQKQRQLEDAYWKENDKHVLRKQQRKEDQERKKQNVVDRKAENKALLEQEMSQLKQTAKQTPPAKVTRAQVIENVTAQKTKPTVDKVEIHLDFPLEENINRLVLDGVEARTVSEAISLLSTKENEVDKHPEKRMKAAYAAFEQGRLPLLKESQPTLKRSQLKQIMFKEWQKSPENPMNASS